MRLRADGSGTQVRVAGPHRALVVTGAAVFGLGVAYVVSLVPGVRGETGTRPLFDVWLNLLFKAGVVAVVALRGWFDPRLRAAWWCLSLGLFAAFLGSVGYYAHYRHLDPVPFPSWTDAGFVAFYVLAYAAIVLMLRDRIWPFPRSMWLNGLVASFTAAAFAAAFVLDPALSATEGDPATVAVTLAYPVADLLLVMFLAGAFVLIGAGGRTWIWLGAGLLAFFVTDGLYVEAAARGTYDAGDPLDIGWTVARLCFVAAALQPLREAPPTRLGSRRLLAAPAVCSLAAMGLLYAGTRTELPAAATTLALLALVAGLARAALAFRELRGLAETRRRAARLEERRRVAQDLHDGLAQELAFIVSSTETLRGDRPDDPDVVHLGAAARRALEESRLMLATLSRPVEEPLETLLADSARDLTDRAGVALAIDLAPGAIADLRTREMLHRILREALTNAIRHSGSPSVSVRLATSPDLELVVADEGKGFDAASMTERSGTHLGLRSMRERAEAVGGRLVVESRAGRGTTVRAVLPGRAPADDA